MVKIRLPPNGLLLNDVTISVFLSSSYSIHLANIGERGPEDISHQRKLFISRDEADLVRGGDGGAGCAWSPGRGQRVPGIVATWRWVRHLHP